MYNNDDEYKVIINDKFSWWYTSLEDACDKIIQILLKIQWLSFLTCLYFLSSLN